VYHVVQTHRSFALEAVPVAPLLCNDYAFANEVDSLPTFDGVVVVERDTHFVGVTYAVALIGPWTWPEDPQRQAQILKTCRGEALLYP
jgi:hypothetical protein